MRVLHVRQPDHGGVKVAVDQYIANAPQLEHAVLHLGHRRSTLIVGGTDDDATHTAVGPGLTAVRRAIRAFRPDVIHAHSSWAGLYSRLVAPRGTRIVYTPHCFAFERLDIGRGMQNAYRQVERGLLRRTTVIGGVSEREVDLARTLRRTRSTPELRLLPHAIAAPSAPRASAGVPMTVVSIGRLCPQKRPDLFASVARRAREVGFDASFLWLGDGVGEHQYRQMLEDADVEISGWLSQPALAVALEAADAYVHVADWEGNPLASIEAAASGLPVLSRRTASTGESGVGTLFTDTDEAIEWLESLTTEDIYSRCSRESVDTAKRYAPALQTAALEEIYSFCMGPGSDRR